MWLWSESDVVHCPGFAQVEEFVASVARLFEEVICSLSLRSGCLVLPQVLALYLCFRLKTQRVWRVVVEWLLRLMDTPSV